MKLLNIGCGSHFHRAWTNIDVIPCSPDVTEWDIRKGLPFDDAEFDAVYHSHVLEHLATGAADTFMKEAVRVLKPGAIMRVVVPDLETIARLYLEKIETAARSSRAESEYDWMMLELFDQMVRNRPGGEMGDYLKNMPFDNRSFVVSRIGQEANSFWGTGINARRLSLMARLRRTRPSSIFKRARFLVASLVVALVGGREASAAFHEGTFRTRGEIHRWMYDRFSLGRLMVRSGLTEVAACSPEDSRIPDFQQYQLDIVDGVQRKPDSLFMEGKKPLR